ncbi:MAG: hypothetical protein ACPLX8_02280 [Nanopusillaceae archaeon]
MSDINLIKRIKYIEEKISMFNNIISSIDYTTRSSISDIQEKIEKIEKDLQSIKEKIDDLEIKIKAITDQLSLFATVDQIKTLETFIDYMNPMDFMTKKEAEKIIDERIKKYLESLLNKDKYTNIKEKY